MSSLVRRSRIRWKAPDIFLTSEDLSAQGLGTVFAIFLGVLLLLRIATRTTSRLVRGVALTGAWAALTITPALRVISNNLGHGDSYKYKLQFLSDAGAAGLPMAHTGTAGATEPLYLLLIRALRTITDDPRVFFLIVYGIISFGLVYFIAKTIRSAHPILPLLLVFPSWLHAFSGMRNWMAIALVLVALTWYMRKRTLWFYVWVAIATGFHFSAALTFVFPLVAWLLFRRRGIVWTVFILAVLNAAAYGSSSLLSQLFAGTRYEDYLAGETSSITFILPMLTLTLIGLFFVQRSELFSDFERRLLTFPIFFSSIITIILFYGGYRYVNYAVIPLAVIAAWALTALRARFPQDLVARVFGRVAIYVTLCIWATANLRTVINLSHVFPVIWGE
ncbi:MAG: EpsG family protein [Microbacterium sp.]